VPDTARTAIVKASFYDPEVNRTYAEMAAHYGTAILPARARKPRDKAKASYCTLSRWRRRDAQDPSCARLAASAFRGDCDV
jgi:transposase